MTWYVDPKSGLDSSDGRTLEGAFKSLAQAIRKASDGDTVLLVPGIYERDLPSLLAAARAGHITVGVVGGH